MSTLRRRILVATSLACLLLGTAGIATTGAAARNPTWTLFVGRDPGAVGWGLANTSLQSPGPLIDVEVGDNLTLNMTSLDGRNHNWYIDYNNDSRANGNDTTTKSPNFNANRLWNFTVSNQTGTFRYRSDRAGDQALWGNITIRAAGTTPLAGGLNLFLIGGLAIVGVAILAIAVLAYRRPREPPAPPPQ